MEYPLWATPQRRARLVKLFQDSGGFCVHGHHPCPNPEHHYEYFIDGLIRDWVSDDRADREALWQRELQLMHQQPDRKGWKRRFDPVSREAFLAQQPPYYLEAVGVSGLTFTRVAKVRIPSTYMRLFVDVAKAKAQSKNQRRKARRYGLPVTESETVDERCNLAVKDFWTKLS